jgi:hypothetical protein
VSFILLAGGQQLTGRSVEVDKDEEIDTILSSLRDHGFINFYGELDSPLRSWKLMIRDAAFRYIHGTHSRYWSLPTQGPMERSSRLHPLPARRRAPRLHHRPIGMVGRRRFQEGIVAHAKKERGRAEYLGILEPRQHDIRPAGCLVQRMCNITCYQIECR